MLRHYTIMSYKYFLLGLSALVTTSVFASAQPAIATSSGNALKVSSARIVKAPGGSYITGSLQPSFGYAAPSSPHVHVTVYDVDGRMLTEKVDKVSRNRLVRSHLQPRPRASYVAFVPWSPSQIARITVVQHSGHTHSAS